MKKQSLRGSLRLRELVIHNKAFFQFKEYGPLFDVNAKVHISCGTALRDAMHMREQNIPCHGATNEKINFQPLGHITHMAQHLVQGLIDWCLLSNAEHEPCAPISVEQRPCSDCPAVPSNRRI